MHQASIPGTESGASRSSETKGGAPRSSESDTKKRFTPEDELRYAHGGLFTDAELAEFSRYSHALAPMRDLPRTYVPGTQTAVSYRRRPYGPYDHLTQPPPGPLRTFRTAMHRGQTKLCVIELEALVRALHRIPALKYVLYAGAAPGDHIAFLVEAFPTLEFYLVDPAEFRIERRYHAFPGVKERVHIVRGLFTDGMAREWVGRAAETFFISDIRSGDHSQDGFEEEVEQNMGAQRGWWDIARFAGALFKLRFPYTDGRADTRCSYLAGEVLLQPFGPHTSTEGRLLVWDGAGEAEYDAREYEDYYYWLNTVIREWASFDHGFDLGLVEGLCRCFDCSRTVQAFREYVAAYPDIENFSASDLQVAHLIGRMVAATEQQFRYPPHGDLVELLPGEKRDRLAQKHGAVYNRGRAKKIATRSRPKVPARATEPSRAPKPRHEGDEVLCAGAAPGGHVATLARTPPAAEPPAAGRPATGRAGKARPLAPLTLSLPAASSFARKAPAAGPRPLRPGEGDRK